MDLEERAGGGGKESFEIHVEHFCESAIHQDAILPGDSFSMFHLSPLQPPADAPVEGEKRRPTPERRERKRREPGGGMENGNVCSNCVLKYQMREPTITIK